MVDEGWFEPVRPELTPAELTAQIPAIAPVVPEQRTSGVVTCPDDTACADCGRSLFAGEPVRPAHDPREVPYDCLSCWWRAEFGALL